MREKKKEKQTTIDSLSIPIEQELTTAIARNRKKKIGPQKTRDSGRDKSGSTV